MLNLLHANAVSCLSSRVLPARVILSSIFPLVHLRSAPYSAHLPDTYLPEPISICPSDADGCLINLPDLLNMPLYGVPFSYIHPPLTLFSSARIEISYVPDVR